MAFLNWFSVPFNIRWIFDLCVKTIKKAINTDTIPNGEPSPPGYEKYVTITKTMLAIIVPNPTKPVVT